MSSERKYVLRPLTLAAGERKRVSDLASFLMIVSNTGTSRIQISIDDDPLSDMPVGYPFRLPKEGDFFKHVDFYNPNVVSVNIEYILSMGIVTPGVVISGEVAVTDIADAITTPSPLTALDLTYTIDNAAAVDKGGGKVGIPFTGQPFETGEILTISGTVNYDTVAAVVDATSTVNEVVITAAYVAEVFAGTELCYLTTPRSLPADTTQKMAICQLHGTADVWFGDSNVSPVGKLGTKLETDNNTLLPVTSAIYFVADGAGVTGSLLSFNRLQKT